MSPTLRADLAGAREIHGEAHGPAALAVRPLARAVPKHLNWAITSSLPRRNGTSIRSSGTAGRIDRRQATRRVA